MNIHNNQSFFIHLNLGIGATREVCRFRSQIVCLYSRNLSFLIFLFCSYLECHFAYPWRIPCRFVADEGKINQLQWIEASKHGDWGNDRWVVLVLLQGFWCSGLRVAHAYHWSLGVIYAFLFEPVLSFCSWGW